MMQHQFRSVQDPCARTQTDFQAIFKASIKNSAAFSTICSSNVREEHFGTIYPAL